MTHFPPARTNWGFRKTGLFGSFQAIHFADAADGVPSAAFVRAGVAPCRRGHERLQVGRFVGAAFQPAAGSPTRACRSR